ncbi:MAG: aminopeptidase P family protein [Ruminococcaceae bacterium]|nr:aminopeptidase P family protein [Oscillospiraceae bacterium]
MNYLDLRIEKVKNAVLAAADAVLITDDITRKYVFNFNSTAGYGIVSKNRCELYLDFRYYEIACIAQRNGEISKDVVIKEAVVSRESVLKEFIEREKISNLLYENTRMTCSQFDALEKSLCGICKLQAAQELFDDLRTVKDEYELQRMIEAQRITDMSFDHIVSFIKKGMTEREIALELEFFMKKNGSQGMSFDIICVSGTKSSLPHGTPDETVVKEGFLTLDFGAKFEGYCSDMTRTVCIGKPDSEMLHIYDTVLSAQNAAFEKIKGDVAGCDVDKAARDLIDLAGFEGCFGHSLGHGLGLEIHESAVFSKNYKKEIPQGAVLSVEPGIYIEGKCGVRIEDVVFLTENGCKNLTNSTKDIIIIQ